MTEAPRKRILHVNDDAAARYVVAKLLAAEGHETLEARTGEEGLRRSLELPDLILLDVNLPDMSGFEVCRMIKAEPRTARIPVVHLSATCARSDDRIHGLEGGADGYLTQPIDGRELLATIKAHLRMRDIETAAFEHETRYRVLFESESDAIVVFDAASHRIVDANPAMLKTYGYSREELLQMRAEQLSLEPEATARALAEVIELGSASLPARRHRARDGGEIIVEATASAFREEGRVLVSAILRDVTARMRAEQALRESERFAKATIDALMLNLCVLDERGVIVAVNQAWTDFAMANGGDPAAVGVGADYLRACRDAPGAQDGHAAEFAANLAALLQGEIPAFTLEYPCHSPTEKRWFLARASRFPEREPARVVVTHGDITERVTARERLTYLAHTDPLTQLPNRVLFKDRLQQVLAQARRRSWLAAVLLLDIDRFKRINETLGHAAGDLLLQEAARRIAACVRDGDTVARLSGDEFGIILPDLGATQDASAVAGKLLAALAEPMDLGGHSTITTASIGVALFPADHEEGEHLLRCANVALDQAKLLGRNTHQFFRREVNARLEQRLALDNDLRRAIEQHQFVLHYQPKADLRTGRITGLEALLRWNHPVRGLVPPAEFIPLLEDTGMIIPVGDWIIAEACGQIKAWQAAGVPVARIAINLSARQFRRANLAQEIAVSLRIHGIEPRLLELEITEGLLMDDPDEASVVLRSLKALGIRIAVDDFGTGYSSLAYLKRFPIDTLKIDREFVRGVIDDPDDATLSTAIIGIAHNLGMTVVAEGVETKEQLAFLASRGCDEMQGYFFSRPLPAAACAAFLSADTALRLPSRPSDAGERTLLIVDDDRNDRELLEASLASEPYRILTASNAQRAFEIMAMEPVGVVVSDNRMPGMTGTEFLERVKLIHPATVRIVLTGHADLPTVTGAVNSGGIFKFFTKDSRPEQLREGIAEAFRRFDAAEPGRPPGSGRPA